MFITHLGDVARAINAHPVEHVSEQIIDICADSDNGEVAVANEDEKVALFIQAREYEENGEDDKHKEGEGEEEDEEAEGEEEDEEDEGDEGEGGKGGEEGDGREEKKEEAEEGEDGTLGNSASKKATAAERGKAGASAAGGWQKRDQAKKRGKQPRIKTQGTGKGAPRILRNRVKAADMDTHSSLLGKRKESQRDVDGKARHTNCPASNPVVVFISSVYSYSSPLT
jgi:hypothetical protein